MSYAGVPNVALFIHRAVHLVAAALEGLFEHPARSYLVTRNIRTIDFRTVHNRFSTAC
ncbi:MAG TPA: hypothetical protein VFG71_03335 [Nitrospiraceae bacterium]|nr:hypothetical protein [Nitrospiraceae bacterium]